MSPAPRARGAATKPPPTLPTARRTISSMPGRLGVLRASRAVIFCLPGEAWRMSQRTMGSSTSSRQTTALTG